MHYKAQSILEYPQFSWPSLFVTFSELGVVGLVLILERMGIVSRLFTSLVCLIIAVVILVEVRRLEKLTEALSKEVLIDQSGIKIVDTRRKSPFVAGDQYQLSFSWDEIKSVSLLSNWKGPIKLETQEGDFSFWFGFRPEINKQIVEEIKNRLPINA
jgi:hypothetical protein